MIESLQLLLDGFLVSLGFPNILLVLVGCMLGTIIGMLPGIGPINAIAILFPIVFSLGLSPTSSLIAFAGIYYGSQYGNSISSILLNIPGTSSAAVTAIDGHEMAKQGRAGSALAISAIASFIGGLISIFFLVFFSSLLAKFAIKFGPAEYFVLLVFAFSALSSLAASNPIKAWVSSLFGVLLATVGVDTQSGVTRFDFGILHLTDGFDFVVVTIGFFAISEVLLAIEKHLTTRKQDQAVIKFDSFLISMKEFASCWWSIIRSNVIGFVVGVLPGAGATIASFVAYNTEKKLLDKKKTFGKGDIRGVAAPESANNSASVGAFIPLLILGVPGSETTAVILACLLSLGITPGPLFLQTSPDVFWGVAGSMFVGNIFLLILNLPLVKYFTKILLVPTIVLMPVIGILSIVGVYSVSNNAFDIILMVVFGFLGYLMRKTQFPLAPLILGLVLGKLLEKNLRRALAYSDGDFSTLAQSPITIVLWILTFASMFLPWIIKTTQTKILKK